jgi:hypothetical protein
LGFSYPQNGLKYEENFIRLKFWLKMSSSELFKVYRWLEFVVELFDPSTAASCSRNGWLFSNLSSFILRFWDNETSTVTVPSITPLKK